MKKFVELYPEDIETEMVELNRRLRGDGDCIVEDETKLEVLECHAGVKGCQYLSHTLWHIANSL